MKLKSSGINGFMSKTSKMIMSSYVFYVDNSLIVGSNNKMIKFTKNMLNSKFDLKDMDLTYVIVEVKISRLLNGLILS